MLGKNLIVNAYVVIREGCPIAVSVDGPDQVQFTCGSSPTNAFEFVMQRQAVQAFAELCAEALQEMTALDEPEPVRR